MSPQIVPFDHNRLLKSVAGEILERVGLYQIGRSRLWVDDHVWWATLVEFQPGFGRGSYLNVGVTLLWGPRGGVTFDLDLRHEWKTPMGRFDSAHIEARRADWWERDVRAFANGAVEHIEMIRDRRNDLAAVRERLGSTDGFWDIYHRAIVSGLLGDHEAAARGFRRVGEEADATGWEWMLNAKTEAMDLQTAVGDRQSFVAAIASRVAHRRAEARFRAFDEAHIVAALTSAL